MGPKRKPSERMPPCSCANGSTGIAPPAPSIANSAKGSGMTWLVQDRRIVAARRRVEAIAEALQDTFERARFAVHIDAPAHGMEYGRRSSMPCSWSAWSWVMMHAVEPRHARAEQLLAQVGRGVDEQRRFAADPTAVRPRMRAAPAAVPRIGGIAGAPIARPVRPADARHAARRAATQYRDLKRVAHMDMETRVG